MKVVLDRQLARYLNGELHDPTKELKQQTSEADEVCSPAQHPGRADNGGDRCRGMSSPE